MTDIYQRRGFTDRRDYLDSLADEFGVDLELVYSAAEVLGPGEDFDGLLNMLEDYSACVRLF